MAKVKGPTGPAVQAAEALAAGHAAAVKAAAAVPPAGARDLAVVRGVNRDGTFSVPFETARHEFQDCLAGAPGGPRVYQYGTDIVFDTANPDGGRELTTLRTGVAVSRSAAALLANVILCEAPVKDGVAQFSVPPTALAALLAAEPLAASLPPIDLYARRPVFSGDFVLLGPGYHPGPRVLVHGPPVEPVLDPPPGPNPLDRLPRLKQLLAGFCFAEAADLANLLGVLVTGLLVNHYADGSKPVVVFDGNQPGVGKSLLMQVVGVVLDGSVPDLIAYTPDQEELAKRVCATLRSNGQSLLPFDNAKVPAGAAVNSPVIEANSTAPVISLRILGMSANYRRPNDVIWAITMNQSRLSPDLVSRALPVRLAYTGDAGKRFFAGPDPVDYARDHRLDLLGELAGMIVRWNQAGRPPGGRTHRFHGWARTVGGIMEINGFTDFLGNVDAAAQAFNAELTDLAVLLEAVLADPKGPWLATNPPEESK